MPPHASPLLLAGLLALAACNVGEIRPDTGTITDIIDDGVVGDDDDTSDSPDGTGTGGEGAVDGGKGQPVGPGGEPVYTGGGPGGGGPGGGGDDTGDDGGGDDGGGDTGGGGGDDTGDSGGDDTGDSGGDDTGDSGGDDTGGDDTGDNGGGDDTGTWGDTDDPDLDGDEDDTGGDAVGDDEQDARDDVAATPIALSGRVVDASGSGVGGVTVTAGEHATTSASDGTWRLDDLRRHNVLVAFTSTAWRPHHQPAWLFRPTTVDEVALDPIVLTPNNPDVVRFLFGGDTSFGGAYLDPTRLVPIDEVPSDHPDAIIQPSDPLPGTRAVLDAVAPYLIAADYPVLNLENPVTDQPFTPHPDKLFHRFTLPGSLPALAELGVSYVSLANDHIYDYLESGIADTHAHLGDAGLFGSGAGQDAPSAWTPHRETLAGVSYSMVSASSVSGRWYPTSYVATETKGGGADLTSTSTLRAVLDDELFDGSVPIALLHTGSLYWRHPSSVVRTYTREAARSGAALVIGHSPHVVQGFGMEEGVPVAYSLGNFALPQDRLETHIGLLVQADMDVEQVVGLEGIPIQIERFHPRPVTGPLGDVAARYVAEMSEVPVYAYNGRARVGDGAPEDRTTTVSVTVGTAGWAVLDLREHLAPGESLAGAHGPVIARAGRDLLLHGTVEDLDVDGDTMEVPYWGVTGASKFPCLTGARTGNVGLCSTRASNNATPSTITTWNRIRLWGDAENTPNRDVTVFGWVRRESAGPVQVWVRYQASVGDMQFGDHLSWSASGGTHGWRSFAADLAVPPDVENGTDETNPRALRVFLRHQPPAEGSGLVAWDDIAVISWEDSYDLHDGADLPSPNARDFLRVEAAPGTYEIDLTFRRWTPAW